MPKRRGGGVEAFAPGLGPFESTAPEEDVEGAFFLLEEVVDVFLEVGGDLVQRGLGADWGSGLNNQQIRGAGKPTECQCVTVGSVPIIPRRRRP